MKLGGVVTSEAEQVDDATPNGKAWAVIVSLAEQRGGETSSKYLLLGRMAISMWHSPNLPFPVALLQAYAETQKNLLHIFFSQAFGHSMEMKANASAGHLLYIHCSEN